MIDNTERNALIVKLDGEGLSYGQIARRLGVSRNVIAGAVYRNATRARGRSFKTEPKLTEELVRAIKADYRPRVPGHTTRAVGKRHGVSDCTVSKIGAGLVWAHVQ